MTETTRHTVLLADDHPLLLKGLREIIDEENLFNIVCEAKNGDEALVMIEHLKPDIAVLDIDMPGISGLEVAAGIRKRNIPTKVVFLTMHNKETIFNKAMNSGAYGYLLKDSALTEIIDALNAAVTGRHYISSSLTTMLINRGRGLSVTDNVNTGLALLTPTELKILKLISSLKSTKEIADDLNISPRTVETHRSNICEKLEISGTNSLLKFALDNKAIL